MAGENQKQQVTIKNLRRVEQGKKLQEHNHKKKGEQKLKSEVLTGIGHLCIE